MHPQQLVNPLERRFEEDTSRAVPLRWFTDGRLVTVPEADGGPLLLLGGDSLGRDTFSRLLYSARTSLALAGISTVAALLLAGIGLYGALAYLTSQRTQEFGVRLALGASAAGILRLVVREGCVLAGLGALIGLAGALAVTRVLRGLLYGVTPLDGVTLGSVVALVTVVAIAAVSRPAWRAARVDPVTALRAE